MSRWADGGLSQALNFEEVLHSLQQAQQNFDEVLANLRQSHRNEVQGLLKENQALRSQLKQVALAHPPLWQPGCQPVCSSRSQAHVRQPRQPKEDQPAVAAPAGVVVKAPTLEEQGRKVSCIVAKASSALRPDDANILFEADRDDSSFARSFFSIRKWRPQIDKKNSEMVQPKHPVLASVCLEKHPGTSWEELKPQQKVDLIREALKSKNWLINPSSRFMGYWDTLLMTCFCFTALVTPYEVVFTSKPDPAVFWVNRCVDLVFAVDICMQFFLQVEVQRPHRGGKIMLRDASIIRLRYLRSWFLIDLISIFPFDVLTSLEGSDGGVWQKAKIVRCIRLVRLAKMLRMLRGLAIHQRWKNAISLQFGTQKLLKFMVVLSVVSHWMACIWGLVGLTFGAELCDSNGDLARQSATGAEISWVTALFLDQTSRSPCNNFEVYTASLHWAVMTLTSIGYGDIVPMRVEEYLVGIVCMLIGGILWAYIIGGICSIISNGSSVERDFEQGVDLLNLAMREAQVPHADQDKFREYLREAKAYERRKRFGKLAQNFSPLLKNHLMYHSAKHVLMSVSYFKEPPAPMRFLMEAAACLEPEFFGRFESLDALRLRLCMVDRGTVAHNGRILVYPSVFNEDFIVSQAKFRPPSRAVTLTFTQLLTLSNPNIQRLLASHPQLAKRVWRRALKMALVQATRMVAVAYQNQVAKPAYMKEHTLYEAFDYVCKSQETIR